MIGYCGWFELEIVIVEENVGVMEFEFGCEIVDIPRSTRGYFVCLF